MLHPTDRIIHYASSGGLAGTRNRGSFGIWVCVGGCVCFVVVVFLCCLLFSLIKFPLVFQFL